MVKLSLDAVAMFVLLALSILLVRRPPRAKLVSLVIAVLLLIAYTGPRWGSTTNTPSVDDATCWIVMDVSRSMLSRDVGSSRLDRSKQLAMSLVESLPGKRVGVIAFAGGATLQSPPSWDHDFVHEIIATLSIDDAPPGGSSIGAAVKTIDPADQPAVVIFSDGEFTSAIDDPSTSLRQMKATVVVAGVGNPNTDSTIPWQSGVLQESGSPVLTRLDENALRDLAEQTAGMYVPAQDNDVNLAAIVNNQIVPRWKSVRANSQEQADRFQWPLVAAMALGLLGTGRRYF